MTISRDHSVSIAKALAIILMVLAHTWFSQFANRYINMFHMPLFFCMAGYCFKEKYLDNIWKFCVRKMRGIYWPFVKWSLFFLALHNVFFNFNIYSDTFGFRGVVSHPYVWSEFAEHTIQIVTSMNGYEQLLGGYWFMKSLLVASLIGFFTIKWVKEPINGGGILLILTLFLYAIEFRIPYWDISAGHIFAAVFFVWGYAYRKHQLTWHQCSWHIPLIILLLIPATVYWHGGFLNMDAMRSLPYCFTALAGSLMVFSVSWFIAQTNGSIKSLLVFIGDHILDILTWHFLAFKLVSLLLVHLYNLPEKQLSEFPVIEYLSQQGWWIMYLAVGVALPIIIRILYSKCNNSIIFHGLTHN